MRSCWVVLVAFLKNSRTGSAAEYAPVRRNCRCSWTQLDDDAPRHSHLRRRDGILGFGHCFADNAPIEKSHLSNSSG